MSFWYSRDFLSTRGITRDEIEELLRESASLASVAREKKSLDPLKGRVVATLFFEPSTRTRFSFQTAAMRLGARRIGFGEDNVTSVVKGETIRDTLRMVDACADCIIMRHPLDGACAMAAEAANAPVINAGDGANQHPTQAILDLFTIKEEKGGIDGLKILLLGDLKYGRTVHSLLYALSEFDVNVELFSPPALRMPDAVVNEARGKIKVRELSTLDLSSADVIYATRIQKERFADSDEFKKYAYCIDSELMSTAAKDAVLMHPLPRAGEIAPEVDSDPRAAYFRQEANGVPVRMAILKKILSRRGE